MSQDPVFWELKQNLVDPQSLNSYSYANNNPIVNKDPTGRWGEVSASAVIFGWSIDAGLRFDHNGIDWFWGAGTGAGLEAGVEFSGAPGQELYHQQEQSVSVYVEGGAGVGARVSKTIISSSGEKYSDSDDPEVAAVLGAGFGTGVQRESLRPLFVWGTPPLNTKGVTFPIGGNTARISAPPSVQPKISAPPNQPSGGTSNQQQQIGLLTQILHLLQQMQQTAGSQTSKKK